MEEEALTVNQAEIDRRYGLIREALAESGLDAVVVCGNEYTGHEGAVRYVSGFRIVHRYAYVLLPADGEPVLAFPKEARWVGRHADAWIDEQVFPESPGEWLRDRLRDRGWKRVGVYGLDHVMPVCDYRALAGGAVELVPFDREFDLARAVKSQEELASVEESMRLNEDGFQALLRGYAPGRTEAELMALAEAVFVEGGAGRTTMDMVVAGPSGLAEPEFRLPDFERPIAVDDLLLYSLELAGPGGHWVEFSRPIIGTGLADDLLPMLEAYEEHVGAARATLREGSTAHDVHRAVSEPFAARGLALGHVSGHSIGMTMIEHPRIGEGVDVELREGMVISLHPHVIAADQRSCFFMQETWLVGKASGAPLSRVPMRVFDGAEAGSCTPAPRA